MDEVEGSKFENDGTGGQGKPEENAEQGQQPEMPDPVEKEPLKVAPSPEEAVSAVGTPLHEEPQNGAEQPQKPPAKKSKRGLIVGLVIAAVVVAAGIVFAVKRPNLKEVDWTGSEAIAVYIAIGLALALFVAWMFLRRTVRTRLQVRKQLYEDPDINDWLVVFNWTPKVLYVPTMLAALAAAVLMMLQEDGAWIFGRLDPEAIGGIWFAIFFVNFLVEEFDVSIKVLIIAFVGIGFFMLWLNLLGWVGPFLRSFTHLALSISSTGYLLVALIGLLTVFLSWFRGLFYYVTITPNYMNLQEGPTESGEQLSREDYNSRIDTSDFLERLMGFGRIIITFKDKKREPLSLLVWRIQHRARMLERVRGKIAIDRPPEERI